MPMVTERFPNEASGPLQSGLSPMAGCSRVGVNCAMTFALFVSTGFLSLRRRASISKKSPGKIYRPISDREFLALANHHHRMGCRQADHVSHKLPVCFPSPCGRSRGRAFRGYWELPGGEGGGGGGLYPSGIGGGEAGLRMLSSDRKSIWRPFSPVPSTNTIRSAPVRITDGSAVRNAIIAPGPFVVVRATMGQSLTSISSVNSSRASAVQRIGIGKSGHRDHNRRSRPIVTTPGLSPIPNPAEPQPS